MQEGVKAVLCSVLQPEHYALGSFCRELISALVCVSLRKTHLCIRDHLGGRIPVDRELQAKGPQSFMKERPLMARASGNWPHKNSVYGIRYPYVQ